MRIREERIRQRRLLPSHKAVPLIRQDQWQLMKQEKKLSNHTNELAWPIRFYRLYCQGKVPSSKLKGKDHIPTVKLKAKEVAQYLTSSQTHRRSKDLGSNKSLLRTSDSFKEKEQYLLFLSPSRHVKAASRTSALLPFLTHSQQVTLSIELSCLPSGVKVE